MHPTSLPELADAVRSAPRVLAVGARTKPRLSTFAASEPQPVLLSTLKLTGITEYEPTEYTFTARAGTTLAELRDTLAAKGQYLPFDPLLADAGATLGGTVASGLSGPGRFHYGGLRDFLLGATIVDGSGQLLKLGAKVVKNAAGFDLPKFLIGSLGRFGVLGEITFKVFPLAPSFLTLGFPCETPDKAAQLLCDGARKRWELDALDYLPGRKTILARLAVGEASVAELALPFDMSQPAISKHLKVLERAGLISTQQDAQRRPRKIEGARLGEAVGWLEEYRQFWERRYSALDDLLGQLQAKPPKSKRKRH